MKVGEALPLTEFQYNLVDNIFSMTVAIFMASSLYFFFSRSHVAAKLRGAVLVSAILTAVACYHYWMIRVSWHEAYSMDPGVGSEGAKWLPTGKSFNTFYRYADWVITVPLLMVELILALNMPSAKSRPLMAKLTIAAFLMIALGYVGDVSNDWSRRVLWGGLSSVPFFYLLWKIYATVQSELPNQPENSRGLWSTIPILFLATWAFYPLAYAAFTDSLPGATPGLMKDAAPGVAEVVLQVGYSIADITAKAGYGLLIHTIVVRKTQSMPKEVREASDVEAYA